MSTPDFLDSLDKLPVREDAVVEQADPVTDAFEVEEEPEGQPEPQQPEKVEEVKPEPTAGKESKEEAGFKAGMLAEREKRKALEARLRELEAKQQQQPEPRKPVQFYEDPQKYVDEIERRAEQRRLDALEADMKEQHEDFDEVAAIVVEAAKENPALHQKVFSAANPARAIYKLGMELREQEKLKDPEAYKASIREDLKAELLAEIRKELSIETTEKPKPNLPRDLSNGRSGTEQVATTTAVDPRRGTFTDLFKPPTRG